MSSAVMGRVALLKYLGEVMRARKGLRHPFDLQRQKLLAIVSHNAGTEYGRRFSFSSIRSVRDFQERVSITTFETLAPLVRRMAAGEPNVLTASPPMMFARTSGTTHEPKLIPITPEFRDEFQSRIWFVNLIYRYPEVVHTKGILAITGASVEARTEAGIPIGSISGHIYQTQRPSILRRYTLPYEVLTIKDVEAKYYAIVRLAAEASVRVIVTPNPSTIILLAQHLDEHHPELIEDIAEGRLSRRYSIEPDVRRLIESGLTPNRARARELEARRRDGHFRPGDVWPKLQAISCWVSGPARLYLPELREIYGPVPVHSMGYLASEGRGSLPFAWSGYDVLNVAAHFFEFIPEECREETDPPVLSVADLEVGRRYFVLLTTSGGLYRYDIDDVVEVTGRYLGTPVVEFSYKGAHVHSFTGEKITEQQVATAMSDTMRTTGAAIRLFSLVPEFGRPPRYDLVVEYAHAVPPETDQEIADTFDRNLRRANVEYESKRASRRLGPVSVRRLRTGCAAEYRRYRTERGTPDAQVKIPAMTPGPMFTGFLERGGWLKGPGAEGAALE